MVFWNFVGPPGLNKERSVFSCVATLCLTLSVCLFVLPQPEFGHCGIAIANSHCNYPLPLKLPTAFALAKNISKIGFHFISTSTGYIYFEGMTIHIEASQSLTIHPSNWFLRHWKVLYQKDKFKSLPDIVSTGSLHQCYANSIMV